MGIQDVEPDIRSIDQGIQAMAASISQGPQGRDRLARLRTARDFWCDALFLCLQKRFDEASSKLAQARELLRGV